MQPIQSLAQSVLVQVLRQVPYSEDKLRCAWRLAVGPDLARVSRVAAADGVVVASVDDERWFRELARSRDLIARRLLSVLGPEAARSLRLEAPAGSARRPARIPHSGRQGRPAQEEAS